MTASGPAPAITPRRRALFRLIAIGLGLVFAVCTSEVVIRLGSQVDEDGNQSFMGGRIRPFHPPVEWTRLHASMLAHGKHACFRYDPDLGWTNNPKTRCHGGQYLYDAEGVRTTNRRRAALHREKPDALRIGLFGDSFTHGDDEFFEVTWGEVLERRLAARGIPTQVLNLGVSGYGIDQAFLRWRKQAPSLELDVVVLGFQSENVLRNHNMIRALYLWRTQLPFSKPRFVLGSDGELELLNQPAVSPDELPALLTDLEHWGLAEHEEFYFADHYVPRWWHASRLLGFLASWDDHGRGRLWDDEQQRWYAADGEPAALLFALLETFEREVRASGASFYVVHLPKRIDLLRLADDPSSLWYAELRDELAARHSWVETQDAFLDEIRASSIDAMFNDSDHYSRAGHKVVGRALARSLSADRP